MPAKLVPPQSAHALIDRPRLARLVLAPRDVKVVLLRAPAGYGKTSLLVQWFHQLRAEGRGIGWVTLDAADNDPERLLLHIVGALRGPSEAEGSPVWFERSPLFGGLTPLVDELAHAPPFTLFLDEFEHVKSQEAEEIVSRLIEVLPASAAVIIASREMPRLPLAALRVRDSFKEIGLEDLRFSEDEADQFLRRREVSVDRAALSDVVERTEGWVAGLQLFALAAAARADPRELIRDLAGSRREITGFLAEEVFGRQSEEVRLFLLRTSILERLSAPLCDALTGRSDAAAILEQIELAGLFLVPIDEARRWYRYHTLFAQFLRDRLLRQEEARVPRLHRTAAQWFAEHGFAHEAVEHAFATGDLEFAAAMVDRWAFEVFRQGKMTAVVRWAQRLTSELLDAHPSIRHAAAWEQMCLRDFRAARREMEVLRRLAASVELDPSIVDGLAVLDSLLLLFEDRGPESLEVAQRHSPTFVGSDPFARGAFQNLLGIGLIPAGEFEEARARLVEGRADHERAASLLGVVYSVTHMCLCEAVRGNLVAAEAHYREAQSLARQVSPYLHAVVSAYFAELLYEVNDLDGAEALLLPYFEPLTESALPDMVSCAYLTRARLAAARSRFEEASRVLEDAEVFGFRIGFSRLIGAARWERLRLALAQRRVSEARSLHRRLREHGAPLEPRSFHHHAMETEARDIGEIRFRLRAGRAGTRVLQNLRGQLRRAEQAGRGWRALRLRVLEAQALDAEGDRVAALRVLRTALRRGAEQGFLRSFADEGAALAPLLAELATRAGEQPEAGDLPKAYLDRVLAAAGAPTVAADVPNMADARPAPDDFSVREREILSVLSDGLSNEDLGKRLFISEYTVKWHLKRIYEKLGVHTRTRAIAIARHRGLIA